MVADAAPRYIPSALLATIAYCSLYLPPTSKVLFRQTLLIQPLGAGAEDWDDPGHLARRQHHDQRDQGRDAEGEICQKSLETKKSLR